VYLAVRREEPPHTYQLSMMIAERHTCRGRIPSGPETDGIEGLLMSWKPSAKGLPSAETSRPRIRSDVWWRIGWRIYGTPFGDPVLARPSTPAIGLSRCSLLGWT